MSSELQNPSNSIVDLQHKIRSLEDKLLGTNLTKQQRRILGELRHMRMACIEISQERPRQDDPA